MARNWNVTEALRVVMEGKDLAAIRDIGRRFPLFLFFVLHDSLKIIEAFGERVTVRTVNKHLEETLEDVTEVVVHTEVQSKELEFGEKEKVEKIRKEAKLIDAGEGEKEKVKKEKEKVKKEKEKVKKEKVEVALEDTEEDKIKVFDIRKEEEKVKVSEKVKDKKVKDEEIEKKEEIEEDDLEFDVEDLLEE